MLQRLLDRGLNLSGLEQVALNGQNFSVEAFQLPFRASEFFRVARDERDFSSARANLSCDLKTQATRGACNKCNLVTVGKSRH